MCSSTLRVKHVGHICSLQRKALAKFYPGYSTPVSTRPEYSIWIKETHAICTVTLKSCTCCRTRLMLGLINDFCLPAVNLRCARSVRWCASATSPRCCGDLRCACLFWASVSRRSVQSVTRPTVVTGQEVALLHVTPAVLIMWANKSDLQEMSAKIWLPVKCLASAAKVQRSQRLSGNMRRV